MVSGTTPVTRFAMSSRTALALDGVKVTGTPRREPDSFVAYIVTPLAVNDASGSAVGAGVVAGAVAVGADDGDGSGAGAELVGDGLGLGDEPVQKMIRTQVCVGAGVACAACPAATARPPPSPMTPAVNSSAATDRTARRFMSAPPAFLAAAGRPWRR